MNYEKYLVQAGVEKELIPEALAYLEQCNLKYKHTQEASIVLVPENTH